MSDWFATKTAGPAANGGLDLVMPGPDGPWGDALVARRPSPARSTRPSSTTTWRRLLLLAERVGALGKPARPTRPTCRHRTVRSAGSS